MRLCCAFFVLDGRAQFLMKEKKKYIYVHTSRIPLYRGVIQATEDTHTDCVHDGIKE